MANLNSDIKTAIDSSNMDKARELLRDALKEADAETYYLASLAAIDDRQRKQFLEKALDLDPFHTEAYKAMNDDATQADIITTQHESGGQDIRTDFSLSAPPDEDTFVEQDTDQLFTLPVPEGQDVVFAVKLEKVGSKTVNLVDWYRDRNPGMELKEAIDIIKNTPVTLLTTTSREHAEALRQEAREMGATVSVVEVEKSDINTEKAGLQARLDKIEAERRDVINSTSQQSISTSSNTKSVESRQEFSYTPVAANFLDEAIDWAKGKSWTLKNRTEAEAEFEVVVHNKTVATIGIFAAIVAAFYVYFLIETDVPGVSASERDFQVQVSIAVIVVAGIVSFFLDYITVNRNTVRFKKVDNATIEVNMPMTGTGYVPKSVSTTSGLDAIHTSLAPDDADVGPVTPITFVGQVVAFTILIYVVTFIGELL